MNCEVSCSERSKEKKDVPYLSEAVILNILIWLPAQFLHANGRYVCKTWANIICDPLFIKANLQLSKAGLLKQEWSLDNIPRQLFQGALFKPEWIHPDDTHFLEIEEGKLRKTPVKFISPGHMLGSCDGISLFWKRSGSKASLWVANIVTLQIMELPSPPKAYTCMNGFANMARVSATGKFKVVCPYSHGGFYFLVLTVGVDTSWRKIAMSRPVNSLKLPYATGGVFYWMARVSELSPWTILAVDLCDETCHDVQLPKRFENMSCKPFVMGDYLSCIVFGQQSEDVYICTLKDFRSSEWTINDKVKLEAEPGMKLSSLLPIAWLQDNAPILFANVYNGNQNVVVAYDMGTGQKRHEYGMELSTEPQQYHFQLHMHTQSLVSW